jgi:hypothetical protein
VKTVILCLLYECETWLFFKSVEHRYVSKHSFKKNIWTYVRGNNTSVIGWDLQEHILCIVELRNAYVILVRKPEQQKLPCPGADRRIILTWILRKWDIEVQVGSLGSGKDRVFELHKKTWFFFVLCEPSRCVVTRSGIYYYRLKHDIYQQLAKPQSFI